MLEPRWVLSTSASVGIGAPVLVAFEDADAVAGTTYTVQSGDSDVTATVVTTTQILKIQVHFVNADGTTTSGEMDFLLLDDYAPENIAHIQELVSSGFYDGLTFHRIIEDFMDQGGDPSGDGTGGSGTTVDDEFDVDLRFTSVGLLAMANSGPDSNDSQFFIMNASYRSLDYGYTIIGKLVAGDDIREALSQVAVEENSSGETSLPVDSVIIDSVTIETNVNYGLLLIKSGSDAVAGDTATITVTASDGSSVLITGDDGASDSSLVVTLITDTPSSEDRPAFITTVADVYVTANETTTFDIPVTQGDSGVTLEYGATVVTDTSDVTVDASGTTAEDGVVTLTTSNVIGVFDVMVGVWNVDYSDNFDAQHVAVFVCPEAPASLTVTTTGVTDGGSTAVNNGLTFHVTGVTDGLTVVLYVDGGSDAIGTAVASGDTVDIVTTVALADGDHTFTVKQYYQYDETTVGNRTIEAGELYSDASDSTVSLTVAVNPTATAELSDVTVTEGAATFVVTYNSLDDTIRRSTIDDNDILVTGPNGYSTLATLVSVSPDEDGSTLVATYRINATGGVWDSTNLGTYTITLQADQISDSQDRFAASSELLTFNPTDTTAPTVTIEQATDQADPTNASPIYFTVVFSEAVTDFTADSLTLDGTATGTLEATVTEVGTDGTTYTVAVTGMTGDGTVTVSIAEGAVHDAVGNGCEASTSTDATVTYDVTAPTVIIALGADQSDATNSSEIVFSVIFSESVDDFTSDDVILSGTAGATTAVVSGSGTEYTVTVTGMTQDGTVTIGIEAGAAHDAAGNDSESPTVSNDTIIYDTTAPTVTINQASTQSDPTGSATIHFTVVFSESVDDFTAADLTLGGTAKGKLTATVTASGDDGTTYDVAVVGMTSSGTVTAKLAAGKAEDAAGNTNLAATSADNSVSFVLSKKPTFTVTVPASGSYNAGQTVTIAWKVANSIANTTISLCYDTDTIFNGNERWIEVDKVTASEGYGTYTWTIPSSLASGTYYIAGYLYANGPIYSHLVRSITVQAAAQPTFSVTAPASGSYTAGTTVTIVWTGKNLPSGAKLSLCYDTDAKWNGNEKWITVDATATLNSNGYGSYSWKTTGLKAGTYYVGGYLWANGKPVYSHLTRAITVSASTPTFALTVPTSGTYNVGESVTIAWKASNVPAGATISLCIDSDGKWNGNEKWIEVDKVTASNGYGTYTWNTAGMKSGTYYVAGYLWSGSAPVYSHLTKSITLASALTLDASALSATQQTLSADNVLESESQLAAIVQEAIQQWTAIVGSQALAGMSVRIADLSGNCLAETVGDTIYIDRDAAGYGWFIDTTPSDASEYAELAAGTLSAIAKTAAEAHVDLLTTVLHEIGHVLGYDHETGNDVMNATLPLGIRRTAVDQALLALYDQ